MKFIKLICSVLSTAIIMSCSTLYIPIPSEDVDISEGFGIIKTNDFVLAASNKFWVKEPQELTDYFITFYISFRNISGDKITIDPAEISLLDEDGSQFDVVLPEEVINLLMPEEIMFDQFNQIEEDNEEVYEAWRDARNNLLIETFHFGNVLPNAQKTGYIFFPKLKSKNQSCKIVFKDLQIDFIREE